MEELERKCLECDSKLYGRADQKFCSDACRNSFNNRAKAETTNYVRNVNNALRINRKILDELNPGEKAKTSREKMLQRGFQFNYFTSIYTTKTGSVYHFCYELGYMQLDSGEVLIVRREASKN
jgi:hypothetical protein